MQLGKWDVEVDGQVYAVTVDRGENGKDTIRVNARVAARPMGPDDTDRSIDVGGWTYIVSRQGTRQFNLERGDGPAEVKSPRTQARELQQRESNLDAMTVLARSNAPVALHQDPLFKRLPIFGYVAVILGVVVLMYMLKGPSYDKVAFARVNRVLSEMHSEKTSQFAVTFWFKNKKILEQSEMSLASDQFDRWRQAKDLYRQVGNYEVIDSKVIDDDKAPTAIVRFVLEGKEYRVRVPKDRPISWED